MHNICYLTNDGNGVNKNNDDNGNEDDDYICKHIKIEYIHYIVQQYITYMTYVILPLSYPISSNQTISSFI